MAWRAKAELMKTFTTSQTQAAQEWRPQLERFVSDGIIIVVETMADYDTLPIIVQDMIALRDQL